LVYDSSVGVGEYSDECESLVDRMVQMCSDQGGVSPRYIAIEVGLFGLGEMGSPHLCKGSEGDKYYGFASKFVEFEQDSRVYVGCEDGLRGGVEVDDSLVVVTHIEDDSGGSELLDIQSLAVFGDQIGDNSISTEWVVERVKGFCHVVGLSCAGFEDKLIALFNDIEAHHYSNGAGHVTNVSAKFGNRRQREVKRLECLVNYDMKGG